MDLLGYNLVFFFRIFVPIFLLFSADAESPAGCNGYYKNKTGNITSPGYPSPYPQNADCSYIIGVQTLSIIRITFHDIRFEVPDKNGVLDSLRYGSGRIVNLDGGNREGQIIGREIPQPIELTTDSGMWLHLKTDDAVGYRGFALTWEILDYCGGNFSETTGTFETPGYPRLYPNNLNCLYTIQLNYTSRIQIKSDSEFMIEPDYDFLVMETDTNHTQIIFSGEDALDFEVEAKVVKFRFTTDYSIQNVGAKISWEAVALSYSPTTSSPCDSADIPNNEKQLQQSNFVLKVIVGIVVGVVAIVLLIFIGLVLIKRCQRKASYIPPPTNIATREPPSGVSVDEIPHIEVTKPVETIPSSDNTGQNVDKVEPKIPDDGDKETETNTGDINAV